MLESVWIPDEREAFVLGSKVRMLPDKSTECRKDGDSELCIVPASVELHQVNRASLQQGARQDDLVQLEEVNVPVILHVLHERFKHQFIRKRFFKYDLVI